MATKNEITGDEIKTGGNSNLYKDNWDAIFKKKQINTADNYLCEECGNPVEAGHKISCIQRYPKEIH
jgi:hypothetical protein